MSNFLASFLKALKTHKKQIFLAFVCFLFFMVVLFPYGDLSDLVTEQVSKLSQNQVFVSFQDLGLEFIPPGVRMKSVIVDSGFAPRLKASSLSLAPSIAGLLTFRPGFVARFGGLFGGDLDLTVKAGDKVNDQVRSQKIRINYSDLKLKEITKFANLPIDMNGTGRVYFDGEVDPSFVNQPTSEYEIEIAALEIPAGSIPTPIGPLNLPTISISGLKLTGRLVNGELIIEESNIGKSGDFISGKIKGKVDMKISGGGGQIRPIPGRYDLKVDLTLNRDAESQIGMFLSIFDKYKTLTGTGARYAMELSGMPGGMPQSKALSGF